MALAYDMLILISILNLYFLCVMQALKWGVVNHDFVVLEVQPEA